MSNPLFNDIHNSQFNNIKDMYNMFKNNNNPIQLFNQIARNNPSMQGVMNMLNSCNNPKQVFNQLARQRGINPDEFIKNITGNNAKF